MRPASRTRLYVLVIGALVVALLARPDDDTGDSRVPVVIEAVDRAGGERRLPRINARESAIPAALFVVDESLIEIPAPATVAQPVETLVPVRPEITILGWMLSGATPHVFVEWQGENHALIPSQTLDETYRFEGIDQGMAEFTFLPEGTARMYQVGDLGSLE